MKILHTADWHIGQFNGKDIDGVNGRLADILASLDTMIAQAKVIAPDLIVIAGDLYHSERVWAARGLQEVETVKGIIKRLARIAPVVVIRGTPSHDGIEQINALRGMANVHVSTFPEILKIPTMAGYANIATLPGMDKGFYRANNPGDTDENTAIGEQLKIIIAGLAAQCPKPSILVGHYMIDGAEGSNQSIFSKYEPVVYQDSLKQFDLCLFGHVHKPQPIGNAFYSGSIQAINFTDEGQSKGFFVHDGDDHNFVPLTTRNFLTIKLDDIQVEQYINGVIPELVQDAHNCVVRVLYSCTDEHNLQFNRSALEADLYAAGAHWVQEITPENITISVNTDVYTDSPRENLKAFYPEEPELYNLAEPIIAESEAKTNLNHGAFVPLEIEVKNYRNYKAEKFDYKTINFATVNGENGAGKSSLFMDSMLDALYEEPRDGDLTGWIKNGEKSGAITFTFAVGDKTFRISRTRQKSGKATLGLAELTGEWEDRSGINYKDTQDRIIQTIGIDSQTLKACALVMQDQYGLFLTADKESRIQVLGDILGLKNYEVMEDKASQMLTDTNRKLRDVSQEVNRLEAIPLDNLDEREFENKKEVAELEGRIADIDVKLAVEQLKQQAYKVAVEKSERLEKEISKIAGKISDLEDEREEVRSKVETAKLALNRRTEIMQAAEKSADLTQMINSLIPEAATLETLRSNISDLEYESATSLKVQKLISRCHELQVSRSDIERDLLIDYTVEHEKYRQISGDIKELDSHFAEWQEAKDSATEARASLDRESSLVRQGLESIAQKILERKKKSDLIETSGCPNDFPCLFLKDAIAARDSLPGLYAEQEKLQRDSTDRIDNCVRINADAAKRLSACLYSPDKKVTLQQSLKACEGAECLYSSQQSHRLECIQIQGEISMLEDQIADGKARAKAIEDKVFTLTEQAIPAENAKKAIENLKQELRGLEPLASLAVGLPIAEERCKEAVKRIEQLDREIAELSAEKEDKQNTFYNDRVESYSPEESERLHLLRIDAVKERDCCMLELGIIKVKREEREKQVAELATLKSEQQVTSKLVSSYEKLKRAFSQEGIPHNIIRSVVPMLEAIASNILGQMTRGRSSVEIVTEKVLKSNNKKEVTALDIIINDADTGRLSYLARSGGERVKASLSVILALSEIKATKSGARIGFLFIDEPPYLDANGMTAYCDALETIQRRYGNLKILAITHDPAMKSRFPQSIDIIKTEEGSKIRG